MQRFRRVAVLAHLLQSVSETHGLELEDVYLLGLIAQAWASKTPVTVTDAIVTIGGHILSRANAHKRLTHLVSLDYVRLAEYPQDRRVKHVIDGNRLSTLDEALAGYGVNDNALKQCRSELSPEGAEAWT